MEALSSYLYVSECCYIVIHMLQLEEAVLPYLDVFATFRENVRQVARQQKGLFPVMSEHKMLK